MTSPLARVPSAHQMGREIELLTKWTEPSVNRALTPPGCMLVAGRELAPLSLWAGLPWPRQRLKGYWGSFGTWATLNAAPSENDAQRQPRWLPIDVAPGVLHWAAQASSAARMPWVFAALEVKSSTWNGAVVPAAAITTPLPRYLLPEIDWFQLREAG